MYEAAGGPILLRPGNEPVTNEKLLRLNAAYECVCEGNCPSR